MTCFIHVKFRVTFIAISILVLKIILSLLNFFCTSVKKKIHGEYACESISGLCILSHGSVYIYIAI